MLSKSYKFYGMSIELQILPKLDQSEVPRQLPPNHKTLNRPLHHQNLGTPMIIKPF